MTAPAGVGFFKWRKENVMNILVKMTAPAGVGFFKKRKSNVTGAVVLNKYYVTLDYFIFLFLILEQISFMLLLIQKSIIIVINIW